MGLIRTLLALSVLHFHAVVIFHGKPLLGFNLPNGIVSVQAFFVISGFYMSLILSRKYRNNVWAFYEARALRIYPTYWVVFVASFILAPYFMPGSFQTWVNLVAHPTLDGIWGAFTAVAIIGQDSHFFYLTHLSGYQFVSQAWTLSIELMFYAIAPLLARCRTRWIVAFLLASFSARSLVNALGYYGDPWNVRFFPFELAWFLFGMLGHRAYTKLDAVGPRITTILGAAALAISIAAILFFQVPMGWLFRLGLGNEGMSYYYKNYAFVGVIILALPFIFSFTKRSRLDSLVGELSYPIYLFHLLVLVCLARFSIQDYLGEIAAAITITLSIGLVIALKPLEDFRTSIVDYGQFGRAGSNASEAVSALDESNHIVAAPSQPEAIQKRPQLIAP